tara:strand:- start:231 stop:1028 length:798 start_codon:yes stop_codon:yes gene_type:complete
VRIRKWGGRLGNNIIQVLHALYVAMYHNSPLSIPPHDLFEKTVLLSNNSCGDHNITDEGDFFYWDGSKIGEHFRREHAHEAVSILRELCSGIRPPADVKEVKTSKKLLIHLRGGDIFTSNPHEGYIMPPLSYYTAIVQMYIQMYNTLAITIVSEDDTNPCGQKLREIFPECIFISGAPLKDDIKRILSHEIVVCSYGTFVPSLLLLSTEITTLHVPSYLPCDFPDEFKSMGVKKISSELTEYEIAMRPWKNTEKQRDYMLTYGMC